MEGHDITTYTSIYLAVYPSQLIRSNVTWHLHGCEGLCPRIGFDVSNSDIFRVSPSHLWPCWSVTPATLTSLNWGLWSAPTSTTSVHLYPCFLAVVVVATLLLLGTFWFLGGLWATTAPTS